MYITAAEIKQSSHAVQGSLLLCPEQKDRYCSAVTNSMQGLSGASDIQKRTAVRGNSVLSVSPRPKFSLIPPISVAFRPLLVQHFFVLQQYFLYYSGQARPPIYTEVNASSLHFPPAAFSSSYGERSVSSFRFSSRNALISSVVMSTPFALGKLGDGVILRSFGKRLFQIIACDYFGIKLL